MDRTNRTHRTELVVAWIVAIGVVAAGIYDFRQGKPPAGLLGINPDTRFSLFVGSCILAALAASWMLLSDTSNSLDTSSSLDTDTGTSKPWVLSCVLALCIVPGILADPTYGTLLLAVPLINIRRRSDEPIRTIGTISVIAIIAWLILSEDTPRVVAEVEAIFSLTIAFFIIIMFGDALRQLDLGIQAETELAHLTERTRLASELHDSVGHHLLACSIQLRKSQALWERDGAASAEAVEFASQAVAEAISETRLLVDSTHNNQSLQLDSAIRDLIKRAIPADTTIDLNLKGDLSHITAPTHLAFYRVTQEALSNLVRHSSATKGSITITVTEHMTELIITDNGQGFAASSSSMPGGLTNMRQRISDLHGIFEVSSTGDGTTIRATVPA